MHPTSAIRRFFLPLVLLLVSSCTFAQNEAQSPAGQEELKAQMKRVMNFQIKAYGEKPSIVWQAAPFWAGVMADYKATGDKEFLDAAEKWAKAAGWKVEKRHFHADDCAVAQAYVEMYLIDKDPKEIENVKAALEPFFTQKTITHEQVGDGVPAGKEAPFTGRNVWWWCDALFMAPPLFARMHEATGDQRYLDTMESLYWDSVDFLYNPADGLFFRDATYLPPKKSPTGKNIYWSRGNGWVYAGIIRVLDYLPKDDPHRQKFIDLFKQMTDAIVKYQGDDGIWRSGVNEPSWFPNPESTGTGFFTYGLFAGINRGYLDRDKYLPAALKAWKGLNSLVTPDGAVEYAQKVGKEPGETTIDTYKDFSQGAYLLAASEVYVMKPVAVEAEKK